MVNKISKKLIKKLLQSKGYSSYISSILIDKVLDDYKNNKGIDLRNKIWAYRKGFLSKNALIYNLNEENIDEYLQDFAYYKLHPINGKFSKLIDDKITLKYVLNKYNNYLPEYYYKIEDKKFIPIFEGLYFNDSYDGFINLLKEKNILALKLINGSLGKGFYKITLLSNDLVLINEKKCNFNELENFLRGLNGYIVTEYIRQHYMLNEINSISLNTLRLMVIKIDGKSKIKRGFLRFGTEKTGVVDNASQGGVFAYVDTVSGEFRDAKKKKGDLIENCSVHPDSRIEINGEIPNYKTIISKLHEISDFLSEIIYFGYDIAITEDSFKIVEINSHQDISWHQYNQPLLIDDELRSFYSKVEKGRK
ncbi:hypothetical protein WH51_05110 [Bacilli bacterium VT-13-104]|nr:hypothetical protein WH51_05110 [Bacilli bacterium VT-13-104]